MKEEELRCILKLEKENSELVKKVKIGIKRLLNQNDQKDKEIERLNNIIDELEKELDFKIEGIRCKFKNYEELCSNEGNFGGYINLKSIKDKLKELKESKGDE